MSYEVTATKQRPRTFDALLGQEFVVASLRNGLAAGRIAHAYLFAGPRGVGKTSAARILARALNCPDAPSADACPDYPGSDEIARGTSIDVIEIDGASNTSVNDVRQIRDEVLFPPTSGRYKIYIIDEVHMLSNSAFNALLKTIEEPPPYVVFVFATTELHKVPATIRSRCQQFNFRLIPVQAIAEQLAVVARESGINADEEALLWIAKEATGSLRDAYTLFDQIVSFSDGEIALDRIVETLGLVGIGRLNLIADSIAVSDAESALAHVDDVLNAGVSVERLVVELAEYFRSVMFIRKGISDAALLGYAPERFSQALVRSLRDEQVERGLELLLKTYRDLRYTLSPRFELDLTITRLARLSAHLSPESLLTEIEKLRRRLANGGDADGGDRTTASEPSQRAAPGETAPASSAEPAEGGDQSQQVARILATLHDRSLALGAALEKAISWTFADDGVTITFDHEYSAQSARTELAAIREAVAKETGSAQRVTIESQDAQRSQSAEPEVEDEVEAVRRVFRGEIVDQ